MKKWFKKHIVIEKWEKWSNSFTFINIIIEKSFEGYLFEFVLFNRGVMFVYHTEKALKWLREMKREEKKLFKGTDWTKVLSSQKEFDKFTTTSTKRK